MQYGGGRRKILFGPGGESTTAFGIVPPTFPHCRTATLHGTVSAHPHGTRGVTARQNDGREEPSQDEGDSTLVAFASPHPRSQTQGARYTHKRYRGFNGSGRDRVVPTCRIGLAPRVPERLTKECSLTTAVLSKVLPFITIG